MTHAGAELQEAQAAVEKAAYISSLPKEAKQRLALLTRELLVANERTNLTAVRDVEGVVRQHLADSCSLLDALPEGGAVRFCDLGTGGGFPLLPLCIAREDWLGTGIESIGKKTAFIDQVARHLGLLNVFTLTMRGEDAGRTSARETFDLGVSRAVGPVSSLVEVLMPLVKVGGKVVLYKTVQNRDEVSAAEGVIAKLGGGAIREYVYSVDDSPASRMLVLIEKVAASPEEFPRRAGVPFKKPLT